MILRHPWLYVLEVIFFYNVVEVQWVMVWVVASFEYGRSTRYGQDRPLQV